MEEKENLQKWNSLFLRLPSVKNQYCISILKSEWFYRKVAKTFFNYPTMEYKIQKFILIMGLK